MPWPEDDSDDDTGDVVVTNLEDVAGGDGDTDAVAPDKVDASVEDVEVEEEDAGDDEGGDEDEGDDSIADIVT